MSKDLVYSEKEIIRVWEEKIDQLEESDNLETFNLYIDNPFCANQCLYCIHQGSHIGKYPNDFKRYYESFLPGEIEKFNHLFKVYIPDTVYFGGGSPNAMPVEYMKKVFSSIVNFKKIPNKVFEANPVLMTNDKLDFLLKNDFSYISLGVQSLDQATLNHNNRRECSEEKLKEIINKIQKEETSVNVDLMAFISPLPPEKDLKRLKGDIESVYENLQPDRITIYPNRYFLMKEKNNRGGSFILKLRSLLKKIIEKYDLNYNEAVDSNNPKDEYYVNYMIYNMSTEEYEKIRQYNSSAPPEQDRTQNCLGLGGYYNHKPYSYHGKDFSYLTINKNWKSVYKPF